MRIKMIPCKDKETRFHNDKLDNFSQTFDISRISNQNFWEEFNYSVVWYRVIAAWCKTQSV